MSGGSESGSGLGWADEGEAGAEPSPESSSEVSAVPARVKGQDEEATFCCDLCGAPMLDRHCKLLCLQCGYQRDCSDP